MRKVRIKKLAYGGNTIAPPYMPDQYSVPETKFNNTLTKVPIPEANIEAEGGETALLPDVGGTSALYNIRGPRHSEGGVALNVPENSFIYSDTAKMKIKNEEILKMFGYSDGEIKKIRKSKGITPAEISKKYQINKFREVLQDPNSNKRERKTAELNIKNANIKLAILALYQESMKGFPDGIPIVALPFIAKFGIDPSSFLPVTPESVNQAQPNQPMMEEEENEEMENYEEGEEEEYEEEGMEEEYNEEYEEGEGMPMAEDGMANAGNLLDFLANFDPTVTQQEPDITIPDANFNVKLKEIGKYDADMMLAGLDLANNLVRLPEEKRREEAFRKKTGADELYADAEGSQGSYDVNTGEFIPTTEEQTPVQFTGDATYGKYGGGLRKFVYQDGGEFDPELGVYMTYQNGREVYMDANDVPAPAGWSPDDYNRIPEDEYEMPQARYGMQIAQNGAEKKGMYKRVEETFKGNEKLKQLLYEKTLAALKNESYINKNALKRKGVDIDKAIKELTPEKALEAFLAMQKRNYGVVENKGAEWIRSQSQSNSKAFDDAYGELELGSADPLNVALGQASYLGYRDLLEDRDAGKLEEDVNADLAPFIVRQVGKQDEKYGFDPEQDISKIDAIGTNTTVGQLAGIKQDEDIEETPEATTPETPAPELIPGTLGEAAAAPPSVGPYPQDVLSMGEAFANRMGLRRTFPWAPKIEPVLPQATFFDPRRAEANTMAAYNTALNELGAYATPQFLSSRAGSVAANAMNSAADIISQVQNNNVQIANSFETQKASILNNANLTNAAQAKQLYDDTTMLNQQYENAKRDTRNKLLSTIKNSITNMATTDVINQIYGDRFMIDPTIGGGLRFYNPPESISPAAQTQSMGEQFAQFAKQFEGLDIEDKTLLELFLKGQTGTASTNKEVDALAAMSSIPQAAYGGSRKLRKVRIKKAPR